MTSDTDTLWDEIYRFSPEFVKQPRILVARQESLSLAAQMAELRSTFAAQESEWRSTSGGGNSQSRHVGQLVFDG